MTTGLTPANPADDSAKPVRVAPSEITVLVVDDTAMDRRWAGGMVEQALGCKVVYAQNGRAALAMIEKEAPQVVLTDLQMPEMDGLELVETIRKQHPLVPVVLMTAHGSEEIAIEALRKGASSYVPKRRLNTDLADTLEQVLSAVKSARRQHRVKESLVHLESQFLLDNDPSLIQFLIADLQEYLARLRFSDPTELVRIGIALEEALTNALYHGNLELSSRLRENGNAYEKLAEERRGLLPYRDRRIHVSAALSRSKAVYVIRDEGPGFNPAALPDPTDLDNLGRASGRGLLLIRSFMDQVNFNENGTQLTMVKRRAPDRETMP